MSEIATPTPTPAAPAEGTPPAPSPTPQVGFMGGAPPASATPAPEIPSTFFGEHVQKDGSFVEGWTERLKSAGYERLATKAAFAKDEATLLRTLDETIGFVGKKAPQGVLYPVAGATDADLSAFRKAAGVPDTAEAYQLKPDALPDGVEWDDANVQPYAEIFHKHHVPQAAAAELIAKHLESVAAQAAAGNDAYAGKVSQFVQASEATFQKEWGDMYDSRLEANRAYVSSRFDAAELADPVLQAALSHPKIVRVIDEARRALREAPLPGVGAEVTAGSHSPRQQAVEIMKANPSWRNDPALSKRVGDLYALDAAASKRSKK